MKTYGLIGEHLSHSFSKEIHESIADYRYDLIPLDKEAFCSFMEDRDFAAVNVTIPYKKAVIPYLDELDEAAQAIGAVNTVVNRNGKLYGYNTDYTGFQYMVRKHGVRMNGKKVLIIGNGGAARAARFALGDCRLLTAARHGGDIPLDRLPQAARDSLVVINATPLGMEGFPPFASLSFLDALPPGAAVFDLVYHPRQTALLAAAQDRGLTAIGGMELLVQQAILAFSRFTGTALDRESVRRDLLAMVGEK